MKVIDDERIDTGVSVACMLPSCYVYASLAMYFFMDNPHTIVTCKDSIVDVPPHASVVPPVAGDADTMLEQDTSALDLHAPSPMPGPTLGPPAPSVASGAPFSD
ncbi:hypothetical protein GUJ93_ZPchr0012g21950 [Zizania palustris]|uniref:Uncharacterized protein n=1 Tax=Zizania palustris TaxID=103762 RepID=A0A8J6BTF1_ZIZPA|nr:hypothetical protein GUJ93_ZPchr0012g21950 [Zizania palustris]